MLEHENKLENLRQRRFSKRAGPLSKEKALENEMGMSTPVMEFVDDNEALKKGGPRYKNDGEHGNMLNDYEN